MKNEFCTYEQSLALKELGFDESCLHSYELKIQFNTSTSYKQEYVSAPLIQQAFRFFRERYGIFFDISVTPHLSFKYVINKYAVNEVESDYYTTYEEAEQACLDKLIELAKDK